MSSGVGSTSVTVGFNFLGGEQEVANGNSAAENTLATFTIPASSAKTALITKASFAMQSTIAGAYYVDFKIYAGATGAEVLKQTVRVSIDGNTVPYASGSMEYVDEATLNYIVENTIYITAQNSAANAAVISTLKGADVMGQ